MPTLRRCAPASRDKPSAFRQAGPLRPLGEVPQSLVPPRLRFGIETANQGGSQERRCCNVHSIQTRVHAARCLLRDHFAADTAVRVKLAANAIGVKTLHCHFWFMPENPSGRCRQGVKAEYFGRFSATRWPRLTRLARPEFRPRESNPNIAQIEMRHPQFRRVFRKERQFGGDDAQQRMQLGFC
jgi:hypothetical protein